MFIIFGKISFTFQITIGSSQTCANVEHKTHHSQQTDGRHGLIRQLQMERNPG